MAFVVFASVLVFCSLVGLTGAARREIGYWRARRGGVELQAEVVDNRATPAGRTRAGYYLIPVVRYRLGDRSYEAAIVNASTVPRDRGDSMTVVVSPDDPYEPYDRYQGMGPAGRGWVICFVMAVALLLLAVAEL